MLYHYKGADGIWRDRCAKHIKHTGPYRAVTAPEPSAITICVECYPWGHGAPYNRVETDNETSQLERIDEDPTAE